MANLDQLPIVKGEPRGTRDPALVLDEVGDHDPLDKRDAARLHGPREGLLSSGESKKPHSRSSATLAAECSAICRV